MDLHYTIEQDKKDRFKFYLRSDLLPFASSNADQLGNLLLNQMRLTPKERSDHMDLWILGQAHHMLAAHPIGKWIAHPSRRHQVLVNHTVVREGNEVCLRFLSGEDAMLFKVTFA